MDISEIAPDTDYIARRHITAEIPSYKAKEHAFWPPSDAFARIP
jgi:hypothetical protein